jgi:Flp pilus assembly pilin Flp
MLHGFRSLIKRAYRSEPGQTLVEYALIIAMMAIALVGALGLFQGGLAGEIQYIIDSLVAVFG